MNGLLTTRKRAIGQDIAASGDQERPTGQTLAIGAQACATPARAVRSIKRLDHSADA